MLSVMATYPIDLMRTQIYVSHTGTFKEVMQMSANAYREYGLSCFYRGMLVCLMSLMPNMAINYTSYEYYREYLNSHTNIPVWLQGILCGMASSITANSITYPLHMIQRNMQIDGLVNNKKQFSSILKCIRYIYSANGIKGFYYGLVPQYLKVIPKAACSFSMYEQLKQLFHM